ncbi:MAG: PQQ-dependent sugar dehydrogenase [Candidatus Eisenbacteria bacterium]
MVEAMPAWLRGTLAGAIAGCCLLAAAPAEAAGSIRAGFEETVVADSLNSPVSMGVAPDGRIFVCEQGGRLRVIKNGVLLAKPFLVVPAYVNLEEGLLGVAFDPWFAFNRKVYLLYTSGSPVRHNVVARCVASGDTALAGSVQTIFELDPNLNHQHVGGGLRFGRDRMLYVGTGDNNNEAWSQSLRQTFGKILRIRGDGSIPGNNPFAREASGRQRAIWARGLRNAFSFDIHPRTGRMFINDVGGSGFEEVNEGLAGSNYGWPIYEGPRTSEGFRAPIHSYGHDNGCAITGAAFYAPKRVSFPPQWEGRYFFGEYCRNEIRWLDPAAPDSAHVFGVTRIPGPVDLRVAPDGSLYYLVRGNSDPVGGDNTSLGMVVRVTWGAPPRTGAR